MTPANTSSKSREESTHCYVIIKGVRHDTITRSFTLLLSVLITTILQVKPTPYNLSPQSVHLIKFQTHSQSEFPDRREDYHFKASTDTLNLIQDSDSIILYINSKFFLPQRSVIESAKALKNVLSNMAADSHM